jgi:hypothetical protein
VSEAEIQQKIQIEGPHHSCILMRNNSGAFKDETGRVVRFGLGNISPKSLKSSDLIGITTIVITPEMVGQHIGIFTAIEAKSEDFKGPSNEREKSQADFIRWVQSRGGIAGFAKSVDEFKQLLGV